jgi:hypothetical protein
MILLLLAASLSVTRGEEVASSGETRIGKTVPLMFHSLAVTGPRKGTDVCWA